MAATTQTEKTEKKKYIKKGGNGGRRPGSGMPKGKKTQKTIIKELELQYIRDRVSAAKDTLINAQLTLARGVTYLWKIEKTEIIGPKGGKSYRAERPKLVTDQWEIEEYLAGLVEEGDHDDENDPGATYYYITAEKPENQALDSLLNRTVGKPTESVDITSKGEQITTARDEIDAIAMEAAEILRKRKLNGSPDS